MAGLPGGRTRALAAGLLGVALVVRIALVLAQPAYVPLADAASYDRHAVAVAVSGSYPRSDFTASGGPTAFRPPLYPILLGASYALTGTAHSADRYTVGRLLGALLGVLTVALIGLAAALVWGRRAGLAATALAAVYPPLVYVGDALLAESLFTPLVVAAVVATLLARRARRPWPAAAAAGALLGLATLTRSNGAILIVALLAAVVPLPAHARRRAALAMVAAFALVLTPWVVRNAIVLGTPTLTTQDGYTLAGTYNAAAQADTANPASWRPPLVPPYLGVVERRDLDEAQVDARLRSLALRYIGDHPGSVPKALLWNSLRMAELTGRPHEHIGARETGVGPTLSEIGRWAFWLVALVALAGFVLAPRVRRATPRWAAAVPPLLLTLVFVSGSARYREPVDAFLLMAAGAAVAAFSGRRSEAENRGRRRFRASTAAAQAQSRR